MELQPLNTDEQLKRARGCTARDLAADFAASVSAFQAYSNNEPFFDTARKPLCAAASIHEIKRTEQFAAVLKGQGRGTVRGEPSLDFRYVERELVPARTTAAAQYSNGQAKGKFIRFDLLLAAELSILCELKLPHDNNSSFYALVQLLTSLSELATESQRERLWRYYSPALPDPRVARFDLYLMFHEFNFDSKPKSEILGLTGRLAEDLLHFSEISTHVRRIVMLDSKLLPQQGIEFTKIFPKLP